VLGIPSGQGRDHDLLQISSVDWTRQLNSLRLTSRRRPSCQAKSLWQRLKQWRMAEKHTKNRGTKTACTWGTHIWEGIL